LAISDVVSEEIMKQIIKFDGSLRESPEWVGWVGSETFTTRAVFYAGKLYPPKLNISMATGFPRNQFNGGNAETNKYLKDRAQPICFRW